jgi:hypothetical protein
MFSSKLKLLLLSSMILGMTGATLTQVHSSSPATGSFTGTDNVDNDAPKAGEFELDIEGDLPPINEKLVVTSGGTEGNTYGIDNCRDIRVDNIHGTISDGYCVAERGPDGFYKADVDYTMSATAKSVDTLYNCEEKSAEVWGKPYVDEGPPGSGSNGQYDADSYDPDLPSKWQDAEESPEDSRIVGPVRHVFANESKVRNAYFETSSRSGNTFCVENWSSSKPREYTATKTFEYEFSLSLGEELQDFCEPFNQYETSCPGNYQGQYDYPAYKDEKLYMFFDEGGWYEAVEYSRPSYTMNKMELTYITPAGNSYLNIDGDIFTTKSFTDNSEYSMTFDAGETGWENTGKKIYLDFSDSPERVKDTVGKVVVEGEYYADSPSGTYPESYRWVNDETGEVLASYSGLDSSKDGYRTLKTEFDNRNKDLSSGSYQLQVNSSADNYPVTVKQRDFRVKRDAYIGYQKSKTFYPEYELGSNKVEIYTRGSNYISYNATWDECHDPIVGLEPGNNSYEQTTSPILNATTGCPDLTNVTFRDARTDSIIQEYENVGNNEPLSAETDLSIGETYEWYIRACDQGVCHDTGTYTFTIGENPSTSSSDSSVTEEEITTKGLDTVIRDEDFNPFGKNNSVGTPLSKGYINKLEEESDQLEDGMSTDTLQSYKDRIWVNSDGSNDSADQYAITKYRDWSISNRGKPYPPWNTYYRDTDNKRNTIDDSTVLKTQKVFANSLAVVAQEDVYSDSGELVAQDGAGVWIDPDNIEWVKTGGKYEYTQGQWDELLNFNMDITGPDSGLGYDNNETTREYSQGRKVVQTDIHWKQKN